MHTAEVCTTLKLSCAPKRTTQPTMMEHIRLDESPTDILTVSIASFSIIHAQSTPSELGEEMI